MNTNYEHQITKYTKRDALSAMLLFAIFLAMYAVLAMLELRVPFVKNNIRTFGTVTNIALVGITIAFVKGNHQKLDTIGLYNGKWKKSVGMGCVLAGILFFNNCLSHILGGSSFIPAKKIVVLVVFYLGVSLAEELTFRGYIGTRIYGVIKNKYLAVTVTGLLFIVMHFPYRMIAYGMTLQDLTVGSLGWIINLFVTHVILNFIYMKTSSLYGAIIPHWISNLAFNIVER